jgi:hypothetical protein
MDRLLNESLARKAIRVRYGYLNFHRICAYAHARPQTSISGPSPMGKPLAGLLVKLGAPSAKSHLLEGTGCYP